MAPVKCVVRVYGGEGGDGEVRNRMLRTAVIEVLANANVAGGGSGFGDGHDDDIGFGSISRGRRLFSSSLLGWEEGQGGEGAEATIETKSTGGGDLDPARGGPRRRPGGDADPVGYQVQGANPDSWPRLSVIETAVHLRVKLTRFFARRKNFFPHLARHKACTLNRNRLSAQVLRPPGAGWNPTASSASLSSLSRASVVSPSMASLSSLPSLAARVPEARARRRASHFRNAWLFQNISMWGKQCGFWNVV